MIISVDQYALIRRVIERGEYGLSDAACPSIVRARNREECSFCRVEPYSSLGHEDDCPWTSFVAAFGGPPLSCHPFGAELDPFDGTPAEHADWCPTASVPARQYPKIPDAEG
jgi:hypothetical protein